MNFIVAQLLMHVDATSALRIFLHILLSPRYGMARLVAPGMRGVLECLDELQRHIAVHLPSLSKTLEALSIGPVLYATEWFLTMFTYVLEGDLRNSAFSYILSDGRRAMFQLALALLDRHAPQIIQGAKQSTEAGALEALKCIGQQRGSDYCGWDIVEAARAFHLGVDKETL